VACLQGRKVSSLRGWPQLERHLRSRVVSLRANNGREHQDLFTGNEQSRLRVLYRGWRFRVQQNLSTFLSRFNFK
jgi:hypothetical protein